MEEMIDVLDVFTGEKTGEVISKNEAHRTGIWHGSIHVLIVNNDKSKTLLQKRCSEKKLYPNAWDIAVGGHISAGEDDITSAKRELEEELGLNSDELNYLYNNAFDWSKILNISDSQNAIKIIKAEITSLTSVPFEIKLDTETIKKTSSGIESLQAAYQELYNAVQEGKIGEELAFSFADS